MPILAILALMWIASLSSCAQNAGAMTIEDSRDYDNKIDVSIRDEIKDYVCGYLDCYAPLRVDELKVNGTQLAALHVSLHYIF